MNEKNLSVPATLGEQARTRLAGRNVVFVGLMGAGKSAIGRMVAQQLKVSFIDTDVEIERVSRMTISELFATYGEEEFRALETRVIKRLLRGGPKVISTGGGAFINDNTRRHITRGSVSLWLKADIEVLWERVNKRDHRPLLKTENPKATLAALMEKRYPIYAEADLTIESRDVRKEIIVTEVLAAIAGIEQKDRTS
jgi:shikimate kinase